MSVLDRGSIHETKIKDLNLSCPPLSGYNHLAVFLKWAYLNDMIDDMVFKYETKFKPACEGQGDLREVIANSTYFRGTVNDIHFKAEFRRFAYDFYRFYGKGIRYPSCVDDNAKNYFGTEKYYCDEFHNEAYLFVPYDENYYASLSKYIDEAWNNRRPYLSGESIGQDKLDYIIEEVKKRTTVEAVNLTIELGEVSLCSSKVGGYPYWTSEREYPVDKNGNKLLLLAQINLSDVQFDKLPSKGLLQFFIARDEMLGLYEENGYKVVYHEDIDDSITEEDVKNLGINANTDFEDDAEGWFPTERCYPLKLEVGTDYLDDNYDGFDEIVADILVNEFGINLEDRGYYDYLSQEDNYYLRTKMWKTHHKMFGHPLFCQEDSRETDEELMKKYDTLLFQLDSDYSKEGKLYNILIGDAGECNFFINSKDLENLNFNDVLYNWDCC